jgi:hypothetical protein
VRAGNERRYRIALLTCTRMSLGVGPRRVTPAWLPPRPSRLIQAVFPFVIASVTLVTLLQGMFQTLRVLQLIAFVLDRSMNRYAIPSGV